MPGVMVEVKARVVTVVMAVAGQTDKLRRIGG